MERHRIALVVGIVVAAFLGGLAMQWVLTGAREDVSHAQRGAAPAEAAPSSVQFRIDEESATTSYANAFRANGTAEEVMLDFGINEVTSATAESPSPRIVFTVNRRIIMNYYSAKRLAITLSDLIRKQESEFGELEMDLRKRRR